jgi:hypothetical protein
LRSPADEATVLVVSAAGTLRFTRGLVALILSAAPLLLPARSAAQLAAPNDRGVTMGHWHLIVRDVADAKKFWMLFGAEPITVYESAVMKLPGILVFLTPGTPSGGSAGTSVNHVGLKVSNGQALKDKLKAAAVKADPTDPLNGRPSYWKPGLVVGAMCIPPTFLSLRC